MKISLLILSILKSILKIPRGLVKIIYISIVQTLQEREKTIQWNMFNGIMQVILRNLFPVSTW